MKQNKMMSILILMLSAYYSQAYVSFKTPFKNNQCLKMMNIDDTNIFKNVLMSTFQLSDTSISEEEVLTVTGQMADLPNPVYIVGFAAVILLGIGILQFTLGDLTKEEGQARVRDFLATRKDTERKRGYFD